MQTNIVTENESANEETEILNGDVETKTGKHNANRVNEQTQVETGIAKTNAVMEKKEDNREMEIQGAKVEMKVYTYRWFIIALYGLFACASLYQINQFTIINNVISKYYKVSEFEVDFSQLLFTITLFCFMTPTLMLTEKYNLRWVGLICSGLTFAGSILKLLGVSPNSDSFKFILLAQALSGVGQVFMIMLPAKIVAVWCSQEEQNRACGLTLWGGQIGMLAGAVIPIYFVGEYGTNEEIKQGISKLLYSNAVFCGLTFAAVYFFFKAKPPLPPSPQQVAVKDAKTDLRAALCELIRNKDYVWLNIIYGISCGIWGVFGIWVNRIYLNYFPDDLTDLATISILTTVFGGVIGNVLFGYILDKTLKYRLMTFLSLLCTTISYALLSFCLEMRSHVSSYITMILFGFFASSSVNISFQYVAEVTYPISETVSLAILQISIAAVTIGYTYLFNLVLDHSFFIVIHIIIFISLCCITACTYFLSLSLKRMLVTENAIISEK